MAYDESQILVNKLNESKKIVNGIEVIKHIINEEQGKEINKKAGNYYTIDLSKHNIRDTTTCVKLEKTLADVLKEIISEKKLIGKKSLIVGLGNINVTPDALGPYVVDNVIVTRHLFELNKISEGFSNVSAISPGVMGTTGIETYDIISSVVKEIECDYLIVVDALATSSIARSWIWCW